MGNNKVFEWIETALFLMELESSHCRRLALVAIAEELDKTTSLYLSGRTRCVDYIFYRRPFDSNSNVTKMMGNLKMRFFLFSGSSDACYWGMERHGTCPPN